MVERVLRYLGAAREPVAGHWVIIGAPLEATTTYGKGTAGGPDALRLASDCLEEYCPLSDRELGQVGFSDLRNIPLNLVPFPKNLDFIRNGVAKAVKAEGRPLLLGGEHTVTWPAFEAVLAANRDLVLVQFDAHADLREDYEGETCSHACVVRRIAEMVGFERIFQVGIRSGTREEWGLMRQHATLYPPTREGVTALLARVGDRPIYLTVDIDVLDPSVVPGTGTPEPGGISFAQLDQLVRLFARARVAGADVVELAPNLDPSGVSSVVAAKVVRTILLVL